MKRISVKDSETVYDVALREYSNVEGAFNLIYKNGLGWNDTLQKGTSLVVDDENGSVLPVANSSQVQKQEAKEYRYKVRNSQSIYDVLCQNYGGLESAFEMLQLNGLNLNSSLTTGQELKLNRDNVVNKQLLKYIQVKQLVFATGLFETENETEGGIGFWEIELDFEVQ